MPQQITLIDEKEAFDTDAHHTTQTSTKGSARSKKALEHVTHEEVEQYVNSAVRAGRVKLVRPSSGVGLGEVNSS